MLCEKAKVLRRWRGFYDSAKMLLLGDVLVDRLRVRRTITDGGVVVLTRSERLLVRRARRGDDFAARAAAPGERLLQGRRRFALRLKCESEAQQRHLREVGSHVLQCIDGRSLFLE